MVDHLVSLKGEERLHDKEIVWLISELILANTDNISASLEWVIAHLMLKPHLQAKVHKEIDNICGKKENVSLNKLFLYIVPLLITSLKSYLAICRYIVVVVNFDCF